LGLAQEHILNLLKCAEYWDNYGFLVILLSLIYFQVMAIIVPDWDIYWTVSHGYHEKSVFAASADQSDELKLHSADMPKV
jgi:hypothetical protein